MSLKEMKLKDLMKFSNSEDKTSNEIKISSIAIIGMACYFPDAETPEQLWKNISFSKCSIREFPKSRITDLTSYLKKIGKENVSFLKGAYLESIDNFDAEFFNIQVKEANIMNPLQRLFLQNVWNTIEDAGYGGDKLKGTNTGVYLGHMGYVEEYDYLQILMKKYTNDQLSPAMTGSMASIIPSRISYILDLKGPSILIDTACSSSLVAIHTASQAIRNGDCDQAIAGGIRIGLFPFEDGIKVGIESMDGFTRSFDDSSDGTGTGEGVGSVLLKPLNKALEDGDNIYAILSGSAINQDGASMGLTAPNPTSQTDVIKKAWENAKVDPKTISYIEAHGTGTRIGDPIEINGITKAFRSFTRQRQFCGIGSIKTNIGHLYGASGIAALIKAILCLKNKEIPPSLHFSVPNEKINFLDSPVYLVNTLREWESNEVPRRCGISSFGFSGTNCHVVLEEYIEQDKVEEYKEDKKRIFTLSAKKQKLLNEYIKKYIEFLDENRDIAIDDICYTASTGRGHYEYRIAIIVESTEDLHIKLKNIKNFEQKSSSKVYYGYCDKKHFIDNIQLKAHLSLSNEDDFQELCNFYVKGADIDWNILYKGEKRKLVSLPTYCFNKKSFWDTIEILE